MAPLLDTIAAILGVLEAGLGIASKLDDDRSADAYYAADEHMSTHIRFQALVQERDRLRREVGHGRQLRDLRSELYDQLEMLERSELPQIESMVQRASDLWETDRSTAEKLLDEAQRRNNRAKELVSLARDTEYVVGRWIAGDDIGTELEELKARIRKLR